MSAFITTDRHGSSNAGPHLSIEGLYLGLRIGPKMAASPVTFFVALRYTR
jgi:hypothetical protein